MKTIKYTLGILVMVITFSSCTVEEIELASAAGVIVEQTTNSTQTTTDSNTQTTVTTAAVKEDIDPPTIPTKP